MSMHHHGGKTFESEKILLFKCDPLLGVIQLLLKIDKWWGGGAVGQLLVKDEKFPLSWLFVNINYGETGP